MYIRAVHAASPTKSLRPTGLSQSRLSPVAMLPHLKLSEELMRLRTFTSTAKTPRRARAKYSVGELDRCIIGRTRTMQGHSSTPRPCSMMCGTHRAHTGAVRRDQADLNLTMRASSLIPSLSFRPLLSARHTLSWNTEHPQMATPHDKRNRSSAKLSHAG